MASTTQEVKTFALSLGVDLVGIAGIDRLSEAPPRHRPADIIANARSVISCAVRIPSGAIAGPATSYQATMNAIHARLDFLAARIAVFLEDRGGRAVPVPADEPYWHWDAKRSHGTGDLSHKHVAQAAGLGRLGKNSLLVTPQFGNRVQLVSIVTDVSFIPDPVLDWEPCPEGCMRCLAACPAGAIGQRFAVDQALCRPVTMQRLAKGGIVESCCACRARCPWGLGSSDQALLPRVQ
ncbi:MAG TPA: hypothetical protein VMK12_22965 [Anaeromyxobacteraceae bacterium]|nr:hypothetical protein [Anaeromyxobacteraceae bacterium]